MERELIAFNFFKLIKTVIFTRKYWDDITCYM